jgi:diguanylate cyclase (GGDEF)-like protein/PAS domain S-box-containing protein
MNSSEELREKLVSLQQDHERLRTETSHANLLLQALETLLSIEAGGDPFAGVFQSLHDVFDYEQAMVLAEGPGPEGPGDRLECIAAVPDTLIGLSFRHGPFLKRVTAGRVTVTFSNHELDEWRDLPTDLISPHQPALYLPIRVRDRRGVLVLLRAVASNGFDRSQVRLARKFALLASSALAARHATHSEAERQRLHTLTEQLRRSEHKAQRNAGLLKEIVDLLPVSLVVQDDEGRFLIVNDAAAADIGRPAEVLLGASPADFLSAEQADKQRQRDLEVMAVGALVSSEEKIAGQTGERTLLTTYKPVRIFDETLLLSTALDITERKQVEDELARRAYFDELTGLPNRALIQERAEQVLRDTSTQSRFALAFIDLDGFKHINDYYSHAVGDAVLVEVARRISGRVRATDTLARISGDEFVLLFNPLVSEQQLQAVIERVLHELKQPFHIEGYEIFASASIGVSIYPEHGADYEALRRNADSAMYRAKSGAKGAAAFFDPAMAQAVTARMELEQRLRWAIREERFCCALQPKVDIRTRAVVGFEALVRWRDEAGKMLSPGAFVGVAVELGLIDQITHFVLRDATAAMDKLDHAFGAQPISINIAARQAGDVKFMRAFVDALQATGRADRFMLELTEDAFVARSQFQTDVMPMLREAGVRVSIDDFGMGYSSLSALADITVDELKVDRSFITDIHQRPRNQSVLKAIESLGRALGIDVVAEGVETAEELAYLQAATRIRNAQGYYFAKPMFVDDLVGTRLNLAVSA